jgi:glutamyl-tRNA reductase
MQDNRAEENNPHELHQGCLCSSIQQELYLWGIDHHRASTEAREQVHMDREKIRAFIQGSLEEEGFISAIPLCTCNRTELYMEVRRDYPLREMMHRSLRRVGIDPGLFESDHGLRLSGLESVRHLYRVNAGLESMMLGESQITGQVKDAYQLARSIHPLGSILLRAFQGAFRAGKRVRTKTGIDSGAVSVAYAAVELARKFFTDLEKHSALLVGAGETGSLAAGHFLQHGIGNLTVINRSRSRADSLVSDLRTKENNDVKVRDFDYLADGLAEADIVLTATGSPEPIILPEMVEFGCRQRKGKPLFIVDIAVPRDVHPDVKTTNGIYIYGLDDLDEIVRSNILARRKEIAKAEKIIDHEIRVFQHWMRDFELRPTVAQFRAYLEELKQKELGRIRHGLPSETALAVEQSLHGFIKNLLRRSVSQIKMAASPEERFRDLDSLRRLFVLEAEKEEDPGNSPELQKF